MEWTFGHGEGEGWTIERAASTHTPLCIKEQVKGCHMGQGAQLGVPWRPLEVGGGSRWRRYMYTYSCFTFCIICWVFAVVHCSLCASLLCGTWDPSFLARAWTLAFEGRFLTTGPPGKSLVHFFVQQKLTQHCKELTLQCGGRCGT